MKQIAGKPQSADGPAAFAKNMHLPFRVIPKPAGRVFDSLCRTETLADYRLLMRTLGIGRAKGAGRTGAGSRTSAIGV